MERMPLRNGFEKNKKLIVQFEVPKVGHTQLAWIACVCASIRVCLCVCVCLHDSAAALQY